MLFFPGWSTLLAGYLIPYKSEFYLPFAIINQIDYLNIAILITSFAMVMGSTFVLNQLADKESDKINSKLFLISNNYISSRKAITEVILLMIVSLIIGYLINFQIFILFILFLVITGYLYNFKPFEFKNKPGASLISNAFMGWLAFAIGWSMHSKFNLNLIIDSLPYLFLNTALYLFTTLPDISGDQKIDKKTLAVKYGNKSVILSAFFLFGIGIMISVISHDIQAMIFYVLSLPFFLLTIFSFKTSHTILATKFAILFFAISICLKIPYYILIMVLGFYSTKYYFRFRFNLDYPNFSGK
ncbi:MAG: UbiA family prenyltransferase [Calditrichia bacterium]|nr:UbiA family prenyltransferase [Calditrichia bacterium]